MYTRSTTSILAALTVALFAGAFVFPGCSSDDSSTPSGSTAGSGGHGDASVAGNGGTNGGTGGAAAGGSSGGSAGTTSGGDAGPIPPPHDGVSCGFEHKGHLVKIAPNIEVCEPPVVCTAETCPPDLGSCVNGTCQYKGDYDGLKTLPEGWATYYCDLAGQGCHGVTQVHFPEQTADQIAKQLSIPLCPPNGGGGKCVGIMAAPPMMVGNSQEAEDPSSGKKVALWGLGMTEATGFCYEITGPGGTAVLAVTDRCGGYCKCNGSGYQECGPCVSAPDMAPHCPCVGTAPGLFDSCCGMGCPSVKADCDWCASNNHPHFDLDTNAFHQVCGADGINGSCKLSKVAYVPCMTPQSWPPGGSGGGCPADSFQCPDGPPAPEQPLIPGTKCCCNWGKVPQSDGTCK